MVLHSDIDHVKFKESWKINESRNMTCTDRSHVQRAKCVATFIRCPSKENGRLQNGRRRRKEILSRRHEIPRRDYNRTKKMRR